MRPSSSEAVRSSSHAKSRGAASPRDASSSNCASAATQPSRCCRCLARVTRGVSPSSEPYSRRTMPPSWSRNGATPSPVVQEMRHCLSDGTPPAVSPPSAPPSPPLDRSTLFRSSSCSGAPAMPPVASAPTPSASSPAAESAAAGEVAVTAVAVVGEAAAEEAMREWTRCMRPRSRSSPGTCGGWAPRSPPRWWRTAPTSSRLAT
mmetsp:Transcript_24729/g.73292  ORF Transcript_24729/g.73292 Transcript_24729/m.73292 type:complete len:205 (+) Transcript_24729:899-1513(+)